MRHGLFSSWWPPPARYLRTALAMLAAASVLAAAWSGWSWYSTVHDDRVSYARARDAVLDAGTRAVLTLNTVDYHHATKDLAGWRQVAAGDLLHRLDHRHISDEKGVRRVDAVTKARVLDAGVSELDLHAGSATLLVTLRTTITTGDKKQQGKRHTQRQTDHLVASMTRAGDDWKVAGMRVVGGTGR